MGCCLSTSSGAESPYGGGAGASASARAISDQPQPIGTSTSGGGGGGVSADDSLPSPSAAGRRRRRPRHHGDGPPLGLTEPPASLGQHINKPLRRHEWISKGEVWTPRTLERERRDFFDTRVTGRQEVWQAIRAALELMWEADSALRAARTGRAGSRTQSQGGGGVVVEEMEVEAVDDDDDDAVDDEAVARCEEDRATALATAQSILTAAEITLPTGDLARGAYDLTGNLYSLPHHVVSDPLNICLAERRPSTRSVEGRCGLGDVKGGLSTEDSADEDDETEEGDDYDDDDENDYHDHEGGYRDGGEADDDEAAERRREKKGKAVLDVRDRIRVKARLSEGARDVVILALKTESVRSLARRVAEQAELPSGKRVRIAYMGKMLKEKHPLPKQGWRNGHIVNAMVFDR